MRRGITGSMFRLLVVAASAAAAAVPVAPVAGADPEGADRVETPVRIASPVTSVDESVVRVRVPLPDSVGAQPAACDWLSYLRYRDANGPSVAAEADRILIAQPGILEGAGAFDSVARNTVAAAARRGEHIEFWALDRRSNCLDDHTGVRAGLAAHNYDVALDYYYHHRPVDGHTFAGFLGNDQVAWLANVGIAQTITDEYDLLVHELPDPALRERKVLCGGHSLGGVVTAFFADADFGGTPGYRQCAGYFALDTAISPTLSALSGLPSPWSILPSGGLDYEATQAALRSGVAPRTLNLPVLIGPETMTLLGIVGLAADVDPDGQSHLAAALPRTPNLDTTLRFLFSRDATTFAAGSPSVRQFRLTNAAVLGALMGNASQPLAFLQTSPGFFDGGPVRDKDFPLPQDLAHNPALTPLTRAALGPDTLGIPDQPDGPLYTWRNYDRITAPGATVYRDSAGKPYATPETEVTDIGELARSLAAQPLPFTEDYFPTKLATDIFQVDDPQIARLLVHPEGVTAHPTINLLGGSGLVIGNGPPRSGRLVIAPGYHHLDVLTASAQQNNHRPEPISTSLADFAVDPR
ncbi:hypothetical protein [Nocardia macrotermitis]|uniref:Uncharacterized protein n=1 Tax=Nocardia macrotermitis TaxID=2585198 RepID=A0A7K0CU95_9NOCA|nr:hypothetical protein [Nocardia macrotermitis]MQY16943.1 hypothetical protein [Nocardia macrotermitis]